MPRRTDDDHGGGSGWRFSWRIDRLQKLHDELGRAFGLTEDSTYPVDVDHAERDPDPLEHPPEQAPSRPRNRGARSCCLTAPTGGVGCADTRHPRIPRSPAGRQRTADAGGAREDRPWPSSSYSWSSPIRESRP
jgi:hypothetical protein